MTGLTQLSEAITDAELQDRIVGCMDSTALCMQLFRQYGNPADKSAAELWLLRFEQAQALKRQRRGAA